MTINDVIDINLLNRFLTNLKNLFSTKSEITSLFASKQDVIDDLATIRSGAALGATALQENDIDSGFYVS